MTQQELSLEKIEATVVNEPNTDPVKSCEEKLTIENTISVTSDKKEVVEERDSSSDDEETQIKVKVFTEIKLMVDTQLIKPLWKRIKSQLLFTIAVWIKLLYIPYDASMVIWYSNLSERAVSALVHVIFWSTLGQELIDRLKVPNSVRLFIWILDLLLFTGFANRLIHSFLTFFAKNNMEYDLSKKQGCYRKCLLEINSNLKRKEESRVYWCLKRGIPHLKVNPSDKYKKAEKLIITVPASSKYIRSIHFKRSVLQSQDLFIYTGYDLLSLFFTVSLQDLGNGYYKTSFGNEIKYTEVLTEIMTFR